MLKIIINNKEDTLLIKCSNKLMFKSIKEKLTKEFKANPILGRLTQISEVN